MDSVAALLRPLNPRRALVLALFVGLIVVFRHLLVLLVFFVAFERTLGVAAAWLVRRSRMTHLRAVLLLVGLGLALAATALALGLDHGVRAALAARNALPERIAALRETALFQKLQEQGTGEKLVEAARNSAERVLGYLGAAGRLMVEAFIGFILAVVFLVEEEELESFGRSLDPRSLVGILLRWFGYVADAVSVTLQFQMVVAACNAVLTFPVLLLVGIPHAGAFLFMVFVSGMVPVVGNFAAGAILTLLAFQARGWAGVGTFVVLTFLLHKAESYYLNPRLAARHVRLPAFVLIVSLLLWEHLLGFVGLFVSFPFLYIAARIRDEFHEEEAIASGPRRVEAGG